MRKLGEKRKYPKKPYNKNHKNRSSTACTFSVVGDGLAFRESVKCRQSKRMDESYMECTDDDDSLQTVCETGKKWFRCKQTGLVSLHPHITREQYSERLAEKMRRAG